MKANIKVNKNKVVGYYKTSESELSCAKKTYCEIMNRFKKINNQVHDMIKKDGIILNSSSYNKKCMYIKMIQRIENTYCLSPF